MKAHTITRKQLYEAVWSTPIVQLAKEYQLSDVGLAKVCKKHNIPRPPRGYWAKLQSGKPPKRTPLPNQVIESGVITITSPDNRQGGYHSSTKDKDVPEQKIHVADTLRGSHWLICEAKPILDKALENFDRCIYAPKDLGLNLYVSKKSLRRCLLILDALFKALEQRGYEVSKGPEVMITGASVSVRINERNMVQKRDKETGRRSLSWDRPAVPSGRLELNIPDAWRQCADGCRQTWNDGKRQRIEDVLNSVINGMESVAERKAQHEKKIAEREAEEERVRQVYLEKVRKRDELLREIRFEEMRVKQLTGNAADWEQRSRAEITCLIK